MSTLLGAPLRVHQIKKTARSHSTAAAPAPPRRGSRALAAPDGRQPGQQLTVDPKKVADLFAQQPWAAEEEDRGKLDRLSRVLGVTLGEAKALAFKKKALGEIDEAELEKRVAEIASTVGVTPEQAKRMAAIQPNLLLEPKRNSEALALGLRAICYELNCPKDEAVALILDNQSILHGREMHLSVADMAHLAMLQQPRGRIVDDE